MPNPEVPPNPSPMPPRTEAQPPGSDGLVVLVVPQRRFNLGRIVITASAHAELEPGDVSMALLRHSQCDWGDVCSEDQKVNERGVLGKGLILSAYQSAKGVTFWIITDPGHEVTTVLLPEDY